ncbi:CinA family protein [Aureimonas psammosilenae]|uniref:CinA family protein n=1 Tax=Aureimonas psammosilenae TaxID=2495496 RepID=UPI001260B9C5|nr:nicotinamide-nucleotide amidohydrolase family protein [Aureimonas psammosilenae]
MTKETSVLASRLVALLIERKLVIATAESCTGGMIAAALTDIPGSSAILDRGFVTYSNAAKTEMIGVPADLILRHGAVSAEVAVAMAEGALACSKADLAVAVTGVAGPGGGSTEKPVGLVHFGIASRTGTRHAVQSFGPLSREEIRLRSVHFALSLIDSAAQATGAGTP